MKPIIEQLRDLSAVQQAIINKSQETVTNAIRAAEAAKMAVPKSGNGKVPQVPKL